MRVKFVGGREIIGELIGADPTSNMVLDNVLEYVRGNFRIYFNHYIDSKDSYNITNETRELGFLVVRGTTVLSICE